MARVTILPTIKDRMGYYELLLEIIPPGGGIDLFVLVNVTLDSQFSHFVLDMCLCSENPSVCPLDRRRMRVEARSAIIRLGIADYICLISD